MPESCFVKPISSADFQAAKALWKVCFPEDSDEFINYYFAKRIDPKRILGLYVNGELVSMLCVRIRETSFCGEHRRIGFIAGVCTLPEYRRRGYVRQLLDRANLMLAFKGVFASMLQPFSFDFYRKLGYETLAERRVIEITKDTLFFTDCPADGTHLDRIHIPAAYEIRDIYAKFMNGRTLAPIRTLSDCSILLEEYALYPGVSACNGRAYALGYRSDDRIELDEFAYSDVDAALGLLTSLIRGSGKLLVPLSKDETAFLDGTDFACRQGKVDGFNMIRVSDKRFFYGLPVKNVSELREIKPAPYSFDKY
ncbi:MAG: GNAT family N-acetyltransferase [Christensenellaceae bacterium]|nr:GNAT family N-acetyltransferase [Christensenellaceae bacterium]